MLILSRGVGKKIVIADGLITLCITRISGGKVYVGIDAPRDISIHREEVWNAIEREQAAEKQRLASTEANSEDSTQVNDESKAEGELAAAH